MKGAIYYVAFGNGDIFTCEDIMFSRESSPGISSVFIHEPLWVVTHTAWEQQVVTLRVCASRWTEVCGGIGSQRTQQRKMAPLLKITIVLVIRSIFVECR